MRRHVPLPGDIVDYTDNVIDRVVMADSLITNVDKVSILIYFRTAEPEGEGAGQ